MLDKTLESPLDSKEIKPVNPKGNQPGYSVELKLHNFGQLMWRADSEKEPDAGTDWWQEEKGATEDEMFQWHHWLNGHEFEQTLGDGEG